MPAASHVRSRDETAPLRPPAPLPWNVLGREHRDGMASSHRAVAKGQSGGGLSKEELSRTGRARALPRFSVPNAYEAHFFLRPCRLAWCLPLVSFCWMNELIMHWVLGPWDGSEGKGVGIQAWWPSDPPVRRKERTPLTSTRVLPGTGTGSRPPTPTQRGEWMGRDGSAIKITCSYPSQLPSSWNP